MNQSNVRRDMLRDLVFYFRKVGGEAALENADEANLFEGGRVAAYREVLNSIRNHALSFDVNLDELGLEGFDPLFDPLPLPPEMDV